MRYALIFRSLCTLLALSELTSTCLHAEILHREIPNHAEQQPAIVTKYRLVKVANTELDISKLTNLPAKLTHAPLINQQGVVIGNTLKGGFVTLPTQWEYIPHINGVNIHLYGIDAKGDLLVTLERGADSQEWMLWPLHKGGYGTERNHIQTVDPFKSDFTFTSFNDNGLFIGYKKVDGKNKPYLWSVDKGFQPLGGEKGLQMSGFAKDINHKGSIAGITDDPTDRAPFLWHENEKLEVLRKYRDTLVPKGWIEFADMILAEDDTIYGTFWIKNQNSENGNVLNRQYYAYHWEPHQSKLQMLDLKGMRLAAVNRGHLLVGSFNDKAMIRILDQQPIALADLMDPETLKGWELLEATSVNDKGQIVGYGKHNGQVHIFLADPV